MYTVYSTQFTMYTVYSTQFTMYTVYSTQFTMYLYFLFYNEKKHDVKYLGD